MQNEPRLRVGVSTCLLGERVRYDGQHKLDRYVRDTLGEFFELVPVCPEAECGLGIPREAMRLVGDVEDPRLVTVRSGLDHTDRMKEWCRRRVAELESERLCGFIFKSKSPSSGLYRVKVYSESGMPSPKGTGLFARAFREHFPLVPVEEDGRLHDPKLRETFVEAVFTLKRWRDTIDCGRSRRGLVDFHTRHKLLLMSHSPKTYREMGRLVAGVAEIGADQCFESYQEMLMSTLRLQTTARKNTDVLQHAMGYFKRDLTPDEKQELIELIEQYRQGLVPLIVPVTLINHYVRKYDQPYLGKQLYLEPHPLELKLRNHVEAGMSPGRRRGSG